MKRLIKKIVLIVILISLVSFVIEKTYSIFYSSVDGDLLLDVASWKILINENNIVEEKELAINEIVWDSGNSNPNTVAPGSVGTFYISVDPTDTDVAIKYDITFNDHRIDNEKILTVTDVVCENCNINNLDSSTYTGIFTLNEIELGAIHLLKVTVEWVNEEENNEQDSMIGLGHQEPSYLEINFKASQYNGN